MRNQAHAERSRTQTRLAPEEDPEFQIAPMIDILLVLLVFFMSISSTEVLQRSDGVQLPVANAASQQVDAGQVVINVLWSQINNSGSIKVDDVRYSRAEEIAPGLRTAVEVNPRTRVLIRADKNVRYEYLRKVMVVAGDAGVKNVTFSVVDREAP